MILNNVDKLNNKMNKPTFFSFAILITFAVFTLAIMFVQLIPTVSSQEITVCCERTNYGAWCQNSKQGQCNPSYQETPSSCEATSFCKLGVCYDSTEGTCMEKTSQRSCQESGGTWFDGVPEDIPQCQSGCCVVGNQAAFTTLTRCKKLSSFYGLLTDFRKNVATEFDCIAVTQAQDKGACVFEVDFTKTCKFTTRSECATIKTSEFFKDYLCSAEELATNCGPSEKTSCINGKEEVYFLDTCGNPANIYDSSKVNDKAYWRIIIPKEESCGAGDANANSDSVSCGNCDYLGGSICRNYKDITGARKPTYGSSVCADLDCPNTANGKSYKHGESWCMNDNNNPDETSVGSMHLRHICIAGEEIVEPCADLRQEVCVEDKIKTTQGDFSQAACRVNRWQSCLSFSYDAAVKKADTACDKECRVNKAKEDCEDPDKRDCTWIGKLDGSNYSCIPKYAPGLKFWEEEGEAADMCALGSTTCIVEFESSLVGGEKCISNCECLEETWAQKMMNTCNSLGDCGVKTNYIGIKGTNPVQAVKTKK